MTSIDYTQAGVDIDRANAMVASIGDLVRSTHTPSVRSRSGGFAGGVQTVNSPILISTIDGVGTKPDLATDAGTGHHVGIGRDVVNHCANDLLCELADPFFALDYFGSGHLGDQAEAIFHELVVGMAEACREIGCALVGGETAEMPGTYHDSAYDLVMCMVGLKAYPTPPPVVPGDVLVGLASTGLHTNGYTLARAVLTANGLKADSPLPWGQTVAEAFLAEHRCYRKAVVPLLQQERIKAIAHITGGGFYDNIPRVLPEDCGAVVEVATWDKLLVFEWLQEVNPLPTAKFYRTFNAGIGMVLVVARQDAHLVLQNLVESDEKAWAIGRGHHGGPRHRGHRVGAAMHQRGWSVAQYHPPSQLN